MTQSPKLVIDPTEDLAQEIAALSEGVKKLLGGKLSERALVVLIHDALPTGTYGSGKVASRTEILAVLRAASSLRELYIKKGKGQNGGRNAE